MKVEIKPEDRTLLERDFILADCGREWEKWSPLYKRVLRTAGLDSQLNQEFKPCQMRMDNLLDELFAKNVAIEGGSNAVT